MYIYILIYTYIYIERGREKDRESHIEAHFSEILRMGEEKGRGSRRDR